jgi:hypothetical protein
VLRTNLGTRPFYNERAVHVVLGVAGILVIAITILNVVRIVSLSRHSTDLSSRIGAEHSEAERLTTAAAAIRKTIDKDELALVVGAAQEANYLIDQRTFSWTEFFNRIESTMPPDVMLSSVRPSVKDGVTHVEMVVLGRRAEDVDELMEKLEATGAFEDIVAASADKTEAGLHRVLIESIYTGAAAEGAPSTAPAPAAAPSPAPRQTPPGAKPPVAGGRQ